MPRPETEAVAQFALRWLHDQADDRAQRVVDACSGSGALALALACHAPRGVHVTAIEASREAMPWLLRNVAALAPRFEARGAVVDAVAGDVGDAAVWPEDVDLVVGNPPYIPEGCIPRDPEVRDHDPAMALFGGPDGFTVVRPLVERAAAALRVGGLLLIEHGDEQGEPDGVPHLFRETGRFVDVADHEDLAGRPRFTSALRV